jgi:hypothetical protein
MLKREFVNKKLSHVALKKHQPLAVGHVTVNCGGQPLSNQKALIELCEMTATTEAKQH